MPKYTVTINRTTTIEQSAEIEVTAKDEDAAEAKAEEQISNAQEKDKLDKAFDWQEDNRDDTFEYQVSES